MVNVNAKTEHGLHKRHEKGTHVSEYDVSRHRSAQQSHPLFVGQDPQPVSAPH